MKACLIVLALFSFVSDVRYEIKEYTCKANQISIFYENTWTDIELFNINIQNDVDVCAYLEGSIEVEFEKNVQSHTHLAYVFVDGVLLQESLVEKGLASVKLASPAFKYTFQNKKEAVFAIEEKAKQKTFSTSRKIAYMCIGGWGLLLLLFLYTHKK